MNKDKVRYSCPGCNGQHTVININSFQLVFCPICPKDKMYTMENGITHVNPLSMESAIEYFIKNIVE